MKKIILLIAILLCTGCYNYYELDKIKIISGIAIDKIDDEYNISYEIINTNTEKDEQVKKYIISGKGKDIKSALENANKEISGKAYFKHLKICIINPNVDILDIGDYLLRDLKISTDFYLVVNDNPNKLIEFESENEPINSQTIYNLLEEKKYNKITNHFDYIISKLLNKKEDITIPYVYIDNEIKIDNLSIYKENKYLRKLNDEEQLIYNLITGYKNINISNNEYSINIKSNPTIKVYNDKFKISISINGTIDFLKEDYNLRSKDSYNELSNKLNQELIDKTYSFINKLKTDNCDIFGINNLYYKYYPKNYYDDYFKNTKLEIEINSKINKPGAIGGVINDN